MRKVNFKVLILGYIMVFLFSWFTHADVSFHDSQPAAKITSSEAVKIGLKGDPLFKCDKMRSGPNLNPVKVQGSQASFHTAVGKGIEDAAQRIAENKPTWKCTEVYIDPSTARVKTKH